MGLGRRTPSVRFGTAISSHSVGVPVQIERPTGHIKFEPNVSGSSTLARSLAEMWVEETPGGPLKCARQAGEQTCCESAPRLRTGGVARSPRETPVGQRRAIGGPVVLEGDESTVLAVRPSKVELTGTSLLCVLDRLPKEKGHPAEGVRARVRSPVLVHDPRAMGDRQDSRHGSAILEGHADAELLTKTFDQVAKPCERLQRDLVSTPSQIEEVAQAA